MVGRPWLYAHEDWKSIDNYAALIQLHRSGQVATGTHFGIAPCLPPMPDPALIQLATASAEQLDLAIGLIEGICRPAYATALDEHHHLWCNSLSRLCHLISCSLITTHCNCYAPGFLRRPGSGSACAFLATVYLI